MGGLSIERPPTFGRRRITQPSYGSKCLDQQPTGRKDRIYMYTRSIVLASVLLISFLSSAISTPVQAASKAGTVTASAGCGLSRTSRPVLAVSAANSAFQNWFYTPWKEGKFRAGALNRERAIKRATSNVLSYVHIARDYLGRLKRCGAAQSIARQLDTVDTQLSPLIRATNKTSDSYIAARTTAAEKAYSLIHTYQHRL